MFRFAVLLAVLLSGLQTCSSALYVHTLAGNGSTGYLDGISTNAAFAYTTDSASLLHAPQPSAPALPSGVILRRRLRLRARTRALVAKAHESR